MFTKSWIYELPHGLPNDLRLTILENKEILENLKTKLKHRLSLRSKNKNLTTAQENWTKFSLNKIQTFHKSPTLLDFINSSEHILWRVVDKLFLWDHGEILFFVLVRKVFCVCVKRITLCSCPSSCSFPSCFSASRVRGFQLWIGIPSFKISQYGGSSGDFSFFQVIHVRVDIGIDISISIKPTTTKFGKKVRLMELTQMGLITQVLVTSSR